jgi:hypothetical protein
MSDWLLVAAALVGLFIGALLFVLAKWLYGGYVLGNAAGATTDAIVVALKEQRDFVFAKWLAALGELQETRDELDKARASARMFCIERVALRGGQALLEEEGREVARERDGLAAELEAARKRIEEFAAEGTLEAPNA